MVKNSLEMALIFVSNKMKREVNSSKFIRNYKDVPVKLSMLRGRACD